VKKTRSPELEAGLHAYGLGPKLRELRLRKSMGLVELARHTGLSAAMLSKLERGVMFPTLPTLLRIALVFGVALDYFFAASAPRKALGIVRKAEPLRFAERLGGREIAWEFQCLDFTATERKLNAYRVRFHPSGKPRPHEHPGGEFLHVLGGTLGLLVGDQEHVLQAGDSVYFDSSQRHAYRRIGARRCDALVVTA
jgi:transcriptional regulator with XRE-family HTH domain